MNRPHSEPLRASTHSDASRSAATSVWIDALTTKRRERRPSDPRLGQASGPHGERARGTAGGVDLVWHQRRLRSAMPGHYHLIVPLRGCPNSDAVDAHLTQLLTQLWVADTDGAGLAITSVVATVSAPDESGRQFLTVLFTARGVDGTHRIDGLGMGRQLRLVLGQSVGEAGPMSLD